MEIKGIDVSAWQGEIDWETVAEYGMGFAILRITEKGNVTDPAFERNYSGCQKHRIPVGVYKYSYAKTVSQAETEAEGVLAVLAGRKLDFPVFYDLEWKEQRALGASAVERIAETFLGRIKEAGYPAGIYCNADWYENVLTKKLREYDCWIARYPADDDGWLQERLRPAYGVGWQYSSKARIPGISGNVDRDVFYKNYKTEEEGHTASEKKAEAVLDVMRSWIGYSETNGKHRQIVDLYNSVKPLPRGYMVSYADDWCDVAVSAAGIKAGCSELIGRECGCEEHVKIFRQMGIWIEDGTITPEPGDIIVYNWDQSYQPNDGYSDHIGFVERVSGNQITCIEGNKGDAVARRILAVGNGNIRGYARPRYDADSGQTDPEVPEDKGAPSKTPKWVGAVTAGVLNVRSWAGTEHPQIRSWPQLAKGNLVDVCDTLTAADGSKWYYIRIDGRIYGFAAAAYIRKQ